MVRFDFGADIFKTKRSYAKYIPLPLLEPGLKTQRESSVFKIINPCFNIFLCNLSFRCYKPIVYRGSKRLFSVKYLFGGANIA